MSKVNILLVDDDPSVREVIALLLEAGGFNAVAVSDGTKAIESARQTKYEVAIVDLSMPTFSGMDTIQELKKISPDIEIIILTGHPSVESAVGAVREHVFDYLLKPVDSNILARTVQHGLDECEFVMRNRELQRELEQERDGLKKEVSAAKRALEGRLSSHSTILVGESKAIREIRRFIAEVAPSTMTVLIRGESGTGKGVVARLVHELSGRGEAGAFVKINCPAIPETLLESELFGHEPGAFTGADRRKPGRFELAADGTVFLDEIAEMPTSLQVKLLQVIEHKQFNRLGGSKTIRVDARILAATNASLEQMIASNRFREDLFFRLNEYSINLPPLRQRVEDIPLLFQYFLQIYGPQYGHTNLELSPETLSLLVQHEWPGNIRELEALTKRFSLTGKEDSIFTALRKPSDKTLDHAAQQDLLRDNEIQTIMAALTETRWNQRRTAALLGISYSALRRRIAKYDLKNYPHSGKPNP